MDKQVNSGCFVKGMTPWNKNKTGYASWGKYKDVIAPYEKACPTCNELMSYSNKYTFIYSMRDNKVCCSCSNTGKTLGFKFDSSYERTPEIRQKNRLAMISYKEKLHGQMAPNYNPTACQLIDKYGKDYGYNFQHAETGGEFHIKELGYWVDGYDSEKNVVIEYYEPCHMSKQSKDLQRQREITELLGCEFIIIYERNNGDLYYG